LNYSTNRLSAITKFSTDELTPEAKKLITLMELGNNVTLSTIKFTVDYALNPIMEGKTVKIKFTSNFQSEILPKNISLVFKKPVDYSLKVNAPKVKFMKVSTKGRVTIRFN
jgi:hypothetical protein